MGKLVLPGSTGIRHSGCVGEHLHLENSPFRGGSFRASPSTAICEDVACI